MPFYQDLYTFLALDAPLVALVSTRIHPVRLPQNPTFPALQVSRISGPRVVSHSGDSGLTNPRYQFSCWAETHSAAVQIEAALLDALSGYSGPMGSTSKASSLPQNSIDGFEPETGLYRQIVDFTIWHKEIL